MEEHRIVREQVKQELPEIMARLKLSREAAEEPTLSGELRRAIHSGKVLLPDLARRVGVPMLVIDEFLTGERTLRSDVMDRLALVLGCRLQLVDVVASS